MTETIKISELPPDIQKRLPYSIRKFSDEYTVSELPADIREIVEEHTHQEREEVDYELSFDLTPNISYYGDLNVLNNVYELVVEYLKNYLQIYPETYPFDPGFGCELKYHLMAKDTYLRQTKVSNEIDRIANTISNDLNVSVKLQNVSIDKTTTDGYNVVYNTRINILINNVEKVINITISE